MHRKLRKPLPRHVEEQHLHDPQLLRVVLHERDLSGPDQAAVPEAVRAGRLRANEVVISVYFHADARVRSEGGDLPALRGRVDVESELGAIVLVAEVHRDDVHALLVVRPDMEHLRALQKVANLGLVDYLTFRSSHFGVEMRPRPQLAGDMRHILHPTITEIKIPYRQGLVRQSQEPAQQTLGQSIR